MAGRQCRVGDVGRGVCTLHDHAVDITVTLTTGVPDVETEGALNAVVGSAGIASCGHATIATTGSSSVLHDGKGAHRVGDMGTTGGGSYTMITGSGSVDVGD